jgi:hypothetical protein
MANTEQSAGETVAVILFFVGLIIVIYYANYFHKKIQANKEKMLEINSRLISEKISSSQDSINSGIIEKVQILVDVNLAETRISQGVQSLEIIDSGGVIVADNKGLTFIGPHRRMTWNWSKIVEIISNRQPPKTFDWFATWWENFTPEKKSMQNVILPVSNRQRNSGFQFQSDDTARADVVNFIEYFKAKIKSTGTKIEKKDKDAESNTNIVINLNQTITDSVVQGNLTNFEQ